MKKLEGLEKEFWEGLIGDQSNIALDIKTIGIDLDLLMKENDIADTDDVSYKFADLGERIATVSKPASGRRVHSLINTYCCSHSNKER